MTIDERIAELTAEWEASTGDTATDYMLSEDDWAYGLGSTQAALISALIDTRAETPADFRIAFNVWDADTYGDGEKRGQVVTAYGCYGTEDEWVWQTDDLLWSYQIHDPTPEGRYEDDWFTLVDLPDGVVERLNELADGFRLTLSTLLNGDQN